MTPRARRPGRPLVTALAVATSVLLAGCAGLSTDSEVMPGLPVGVDQGENVRIVPPDPVPGASPEDVVRGFIRGGAASDGEYDAARAFLSRRTPPDWRPDVGVTVFQSDGTALTVTLTSPTTVRVSVPALARIDESGHYTETPGSTATADFAVEQSSGEWRISSIPDDFGLWLGSFDADVLFRPYTITYVSASGRLLVPDVRWFSTGKGLVTRLARAQLDPAPEYLAGAVRSAVPGGTRLAVDAVPVADGLATVDIGDASLGSDTVSRQDLWAQFYTTLTQVPGVTRVALRQDGAALALPGVDGAVASLADIGFPTPSPTADVDSLVRTGTTLRTIDPQQASDDGQRPEEPAEPRKDLPVIVPGWGPLALSGDGTEIAGVGVSRGELTRWIGANQLKLPSLGRDPHLTPPTYDSSKILWVAGVDGKGRGRVWVVNAGGRTEDGSPALPQLVDASWLEARRVVALRLSEDGTRVAVISTSADGADTRVDVAAVDRGAGGVPERLTNPQRTAFRLVTARDLVWVGETSLAVIGTSAAGQPTTPWIVEIGGQSQALPPVANAQAITTVSGERGLVVTTTANRIFIRAANTWVSIGQGSNLLVAGT